MTNEQASIELRFTTPPSVNGLWKTIRVCAKGISRRETTKRVRSQAYREWARLAGYEIGVQRPPSLKGAFTAHVFVPTATRGDIENRTKACFDLLQALRVIEDDKFMTKLTVERGGEYFRVILAQAV